MIDLSTLFADFTSEYATALAVLCVIAVIVAAVFAAIGSRLVDGYMPADDAPDNEAAPHHDAR